MTERAAQTRSGGLSAERLLLGFMKVAAEDFQKRYDRFPDPTEWLEEVNCNVFLPGPVSLPVLETVLDSTAGRAAFPLGIGSVGIQIPDRRIRSAERKISLALLFFPAVERAHYRAEFTAEMDEMNHSAASQFAANVLLKAPISGIHMRTAKIFGRQAT